MVRAKVPRSEKGRTVGLVGRVFVTVAFLSALAGFLVWFHYQRFLGAPILRAGEEATLTIPEGTSWPGVVDRLEGAELVGRRAYFEFWARRRNLPRLARAGAFELKGPMTLSDLSAVLREGGQLEEMEVTFPEGFTIFHVADRLEEKGLVGRRAFLDAARDPELLAARGIRAESFEGYLFPDTYRFFKGTSAEKIIERMHSRWLQVWESLEEEHAANLAELKQDFSFEVREVITLASIVERESSGRSERALIARVFYNRLNRGMKLQTDPTCVYGEDTYLEVPHPRFCKDPLNRYSTYVIDGLPPGPIANPGRASIEAVLEPAQGEQALEYLYFVARRDGTHGHAFSKTYAEHKRAVRKYLK